MGYAKRQMEEADHARFIGIEICVRSGTLGQCEAHECTWVDSGSVETAVECAQELLAEGDPLVRGMTLEELQQGIDLAMDDAGIDECSHCASNWAKDD
jgi:hypothetical protein